MSVASSMRTGDGGPWRRGLRIAGMVGLAFAAGFDLLAVATSDNPVWWPNALVLAVGLVALLWPPRRLTPALRTGVPAIASAAYTVTAHLPVTG